jgi:addiction module HigA family antidote
MTERGLSINRLARELHVPVMRVSDIVNDRRGITPDTAVRLARYFGTTPQFWLSLQANYDLGGVDVRAIEREVHPADESAA